MGGLDRIRMRLPRRARPLNKSKRLVLVYPHDTTTSKMFWKWPNSQYKNSKISISIQEVASSNAHMLNELGGKVVDPFPENVPLDHAQSVASARHS